MSRFTNDINAILGLTWSQLGLLIATGILLTAVFSIIFFSDWQRTADVTSIASRFSTEIETMDTRFFEDTTFFRFPEKEYPYNVSLSTEYLTVRTKGTFNTVISIKERLLVRPWPRLTNEQWCSGEDLHTYLNTTSGHSGRKSDQINMTTLTTLFQQWNTTNHTLAHYPLFVHLNQSVYLDKVIVFYEDGKHQDFLLVYQRQ